MSEIERLLAAATHELACPRCSNVKSVEDECPECHGEHRNQHTIALLIALARKPADGLTP